MSEAMIHTPSAAEPRRSSATGLPTQPRSGDHRRHVLHPDATSQDHPFSDPAHSSADLADLGRMQDRLRLTLGGVPADPAQLDRIYDEGGLSTRQDLTVVGFRGLCRPDISGAILEEVTEVDTALAAQLARDEIRLILSYSSRRLGPHDTLNLVVMRDESGLRYWHESALHRYAAQELSPHLYQGVRLHTGALPQGLTGSLQLRSTKYYAFGASPWSAQRQYPVQPI